MVYVAVVVWVAVDVAVVADIEVAVVVAVSVVLLVDVVVTVTVAVDVGAGRLVVEVVEAPEPQRSVPWVSWGMLVPTTISLADNAEFCA